MDWRDCGIVLGLRRHGEHDALLEVLCEGRGRVLGIVKGGYSRRHRGNLQPGNLLSVVWRARLETQLGVLTSEIVRAHGLALCHDVLRLEALTAMIAMASATLPEREPHPAVFSGLLAVIDLLDAAGDDPAARPHWAGAVAQWEAALLADLGYGLDLTACAATGGVDDLIYVSPKSGWSVSAAAGRPYHDKLLSLPVFLREGGSAVSMGDVAAALSLTGFFLDRHVLGPHGRELPMARQRFAERVASAARAGVE